MKRSDVWLMWLYIAEAGLFVAHGIDSTRFGEWRMLDVSFTAYALSYIPAMGLLLYGLAALARGWREGYEMGVFTGAFVGSALIIHLPQLFGGEAFHTPLSLVLLIAMPVIGVALAVLSLARLREFPTKSQQEHRRGLVS